MNKQKNKKSNHNSRISGENILKYDKAERETSDTNQQENYEDSSTKKFRKRRNKPIFII